MITVPTYCAGPVAVSCQADKLKACGHASRAFVAILGGLLVLAGCKSLPPVDNSSAAQGQRPVQLDSAHGPLSAQQSSSIMEGLKRQSGANDILDTHIRLLQNEVKSPLVVGNKVTLLQDDAAGYRAMLGAIRGASHQINMETYIFDDDKAGEEFVQQLLAKQDQGVQVNLIYDSVGSLTTPRPFFDGLKKRGVKIVEFNPVNPLFMKKRWRINNRDHRKLLVVDGRTAIMGSINISDTYSSGAVLKSKQSRAQPGQASGWRDTDIKIEGPVVAEFQKLFIDTWEKQKGPPLDQGNSFPALRPEGHDIALAIGSSPDNPNPVIYVTLISAIKSAENYVHITNAYFVPDRQLVEALEEAAQRGVDVELVLSSKSDSWLTLYAGRSHFDDLLEHGVKIFLRQGAIVHSKTAVIDGVWSSVGSTNLDWRSFVHNDEVNAVILGGDFAGQLEAWFQADRADSAHITRQQWKHRSPLARFKEWGAMLWQYWL
jgi:cardiolipin synthase